MSTLALSVKNTTGPGGNPQLTGNPRQITITNDGPGIATNVGYTITPSLPTGTTIASVPTSGPANCGTIADGGTCVLTITPGINPSVPPGSTPNPSVITIQSSDTNNTNTLTADISVLTYGSIYEAGFVFTVDDTYAANPITGSIGGKVAALSDTAIPVIGSLQGLIWGSMSIDVGQSTWDTTTTGANNGASNTTVIVNALSPAIPESTYAAGACALRAVNGNDSSCLLGSPCYSDWYLPAMCELTSFNKTSAPPSSACNPTTNMQDQLCTTPAVPNVNIIDGAIYWSSTEQRDEPIIHGWNNIFSIAGGTGQGVADKSFMYGVRCARALTQPPFYPTATAAR